VGITDFAYPNGKRKMPPTEDSGRAILTEEKDCPKHIEDHLEELGISTRQFHMLFDTLPFGIALHKVVCDERGKPVDFIYVCSNRAYDVIDPFQKEQVWSASKPFRTGKKVCSLDWAGVCDRVTITGAPKQFEAYCRPENKWYKVHICSPKRSYLLSVFMDITSEKKYDERKNDERTRAQETLFLSEKRFRRLFETSQDGILARDLAGKIIHCNKAYAAMLGYTKKELRQLTVQQLLPEKWHDHREKMVRKVLRSGRSVLFEREYKRKDGSVFPASVRTWRLTDGKGKPIGVWSIVRDISEQKERQKSLQEHAEILERTITDRTKQLRDKERLAAIGQTAGMVGHDLRNPLQTITGELFLAKSEVKSLPEGGAKNNLQESLQTIEEQTAYMDKVISDLQAFVQPVKIEKEPINLRELVKSVLETVEIPTSVAVEMSIDKYFHEVKADPQLLKRVLINLVTNALQAMPIGGKLSLIARVSGEGRVFLAVKDTGVGMSDEIKKQIFTPLFTTKPRGQGFGLAVCKRVIEAHGGAISFESTVGKGAEFTIQLPSS
jgi:PAS domain S-box-containing protein